MWLHILEKLEMGGRPVRLPRHALLAEPFGKVLGCVGAGREGGVRLPVQLEGGHLGEDLATGLAAHHLRVVVLARCCREGGGEGVAQRLVVKVLEIGVLGNWDLVHHIILLTNSSKFYHQAFFSVCKVSFLKKRKYIKVLRIIC